MPELTRPLVEQWLEDNPEAATDLFVRRATHTMVNKWLLAHGFLTLPQPLSEPLGPITTNRLKVESFLEDAAPTPRSNSKKHLRHNFAMAKSKSVFRTCEAAATSLGAQARRTSFRTIRKYSSLPPSSNYLLCLLIESKVRLPRYESITLDLKKQLRQRDVKEFFLDIVKDIANDLDLTSLTQKIIDNLTVLLNADGASLYLVQVMPSGKKSMVSKVFDVHSGTNLLPGSRDDDAIEVPWGKGVLGHVACSGEAVNLADAAKDPRFNNEVDRIRGYHTGSLLCLPVKNAGGDVIAVAQVINRDSDSGTFASFTNQDQKLFETYLQFVGIALTNAKLMEMSQAEYERNRSLLEVVHDLFEQQTSLEGIILKTLQRAQRLLHCERAAVLLLDEGCQTPKFSKMFELASSGSEMINGNAKEVGTDKVATHLLQLAEQVATSGKNVNIADTIEVMKGSGANVKSLLAIPVRNPACQIIGVAKIINKLNNQPFDDIDEQLFEAFAIFCGLGIHNTMMYNQLEKAMARQKVAIEVLSYHATASAEEVRNLSSKRVPEAWEWRLGSLTFDDFSLLHDDMVIASVRMFKDLELVSRLRINSQMLLRWLITVKRNYRNVQYHNWRHAFNVAHFMFSMLTTCEMRCHLSDLETLGMFVGCLCHDLDHRGTNNAFQEKTGSALALLYGTQNTMEHHHFNQAVMILNSEGHNILSHLSSNEYSQVMTILRDSILATDLTVYFLVRDRFNPIVDSGEFSWEIESHREMVRSLMMTACDLGACTKPWQIQKKVAEKVTSEFFEQGDLEKTTLNVTPQALMDRDKQHELPLLQMRWIRDVCLPLYDTLSKIKPKLLPMREGALKNMILWARMVQQDQNSELLDFSEFEQIRPDG